MTPIYTFNLPPEENVISRNRTITTYYAQLYKNEPRLYKWAGMAAFASFHIGEKLKMWDWQKTGIKTFAATCQQKNRSLEEDFQVIRIINNRIFLEIGSHHLAFSQLDYDLFRSQLIAGKKHEIIVKAFDKLHQARVQLKQGAPTKETTDLIWEANTEILWHEQQLVVQPMFNKLSWTFSSVMSLIASFDYNINHKKTNWRLASRFLSFMLYRGFHLIKKNSFRPSVTNFEQRWYWIQEDLLKKWQVVESDKRTIEEEISYLAGLEERNLRLRRK